MKKLVISLILILFTSIIYADIDFENNTEQLISIEDIYNGDVKICKIYEYESYYKVFHYIYRSKGNVDCSEPIYFKKSEVKFNDKFYW
jgi:hypothetical protein